MLRPTMRLGRVVAACFVAALACLLVGTMWGNAPVFAAGTIILGALGPLAFVYLLVKGILRID